MTGTTPWNHLNGDGSLQVITLPVGALAANCYVLIDASTAKGLLIDPGAEPDRIAASLQSIPPAVQLSYILATHAHFDHVGALGLVKQRTGARFLLHPADRPLLRTAPADALRFVGEAVPAPPEPDADLLPGARLAIGSLVIEVRHTPGHTAGSCSFVLIHVVSDTPMILAVFTGDTLFAGSVGRTDLVGGNPGQILPSIRQQLLSLPDDVLVYPGHGPATTIGEERRHNPFLA